MCATLSSRATLTTSVPSFKFGEKLASYVFGVWCLVFGVWNSGVRNSGVPVREPTTRNISPRRAYRGEKRRRTAARGDSRRDSSLEVN